MQLKPGCFVCSSRTNLQPCPGCKVAYYCGSNHRIQHQTTHYHVCDSVKEARRHLEIEEEKLRHDSAHSVGGPYCVPPLVFENHAGFFWDILETRPYMIARLNFTDELLAIHTFDAVALVVSEYTDMLRLCPRDDLGISHRLPAQLLRLGRDQECYDFLKFWANEEDNLYDLNGEDSLTLRQRYDNSDVLDDPTAALKLCSSEFEMHRFVPAFFLKASLWLNMRELAHASTILGKTHRTIPPELVINIQLYLATPAILNNTVILSDIRHGRNLEHHVSTLRSHAELIWRTISLASGEVFCDWFHRLKGADSMKSLFSHDWWDSTNMSPTAMAFRRNYQVFMDIPHVARMTEFILLEEEADELKNEDEDES